MARLVVAQFVLLYFAGIAFFTVYWTLRRLRRSLTRRLTTLAEVQRTFQGFWFGPSVLAASRREASARM